jgi:hypothetical protein
VRDEDQEAEMAQDVGSGKSRRGRPIELGGALVTLVEPHRGHEVAYNRWYERDHFYAGCMIGAWTISGARFVATRDLKDLRSPDSTVAPDPTAGSYLSLYWVLAGKFGEWMDWGTRQVRWLIDEDRMFPHRDHVHTVMYRFHSEVPGREDGVPVELALDRRAPSLVMTVVDRAEGVSTDAVAAWWAEQGLPRRGHRGVRAGADAVRRAERRPRRRRHRAHPPPGLRRRRRRTGVGGHLG